MFGKTAQLLLILMVTTLSARASPAYQLYMFEAPDCIYCEYWDRDVGAIYDKTAEGKRVPLKRLHLGAKLPSGITLLSPVQYTPTFVLIHSGRESGRITGYTGESNFWGLMEVLLKESQIVID